MALREALRSRNVRKPLTEPGEAQQWPPWIERERSREPRESEASKIDKGESPTRHHKLFRQARPSIIRVGPHGHARRSPRQRGGRASVANPSLRVGLREQRQTGPGTPQLDRKGAPRPCHNKRSVSNEVNKDYGAVPRGGVLGERGGGSYGLGANTRDLYSQGRLEAFPQRAVPGSWLRK